MAETSSAGGRYYKVGEVCRLADVPPYVLRYWETEFPVLSLDRPSSGPRLYSERDLKVIGAIKRLLYDEGYTIAGAKKRLESDLRRDGVLDDPAASDPQPRGEGAGTSADGPAVGVDLSEIPLDGLPPQAPDAGPVRKSEGKTKRAPRPMKPAGPLPGSEDVSSKLAAIESLPAGGLVDRRPVEVVRSADPRLVFAVAELKKILLDLSKPLA